MVTCATASRRNENDESFGDDGYESSAEIERVSFAPAHDTEDETT